MEKPSINKGSLDRTDSMDLAGSKRKNPLDVLRSLDSAKKRKESQQQEALGKDVKIQGLAEESVEDVKGKDILQQELTKQQDVDIKGKKVIVDEEYKKSIYKMPDEKLQMSSDHSKLEKVEDQGRTVLEKRDDELAREAKGLGLEMEHIFDKIKKQSQFLRKSQSAIWNSRELTLEQKRKYTRLLEEKNNKFVEELRPIVQYWMGRFQTVTNKQAITSHLKKKSESTGDNKEL
jgi:hypothetical protein